MDTEKEIVREIPKGLLKWYDFQKDSRALYVGDAEEELAEMLREMHVETDCVPLGQTMDSAWQACHKGAYDYIICILGLEQHRQPGRCLRGWRPLLGRGGRLLLGMNNRLGLRYFCGDRDPYTNRNFDGIEDYRRVDLDDERTFRGRCYSYREMTDMLREAGWALYKTWSVLPDLKHPQLLYAQDSLPNEELSSRLFPVYHCGQTIFLEEESLYSELADNGLFHGMANAYLLECPVEGGFCDVSHVTLTLERGREEACMTVIRGEESVEKRAYFPEGEKRLAAMTGYAADLKAHGIRVVDARMEDHVLKMPFMRAKTAQVYLKGLLRRDQEKFIAEMDRFRDMILHSSDLVSADQEDGQGVILKKGYLDLVPLNCFYENGEYIFYDQEFCVENCPANVIILRMISTLYYGNVEMEILLPSPFFMERYGLMEQIGLWREKERAFLSSLRKEKELQQYRRRNRRDFDMLLKNRKRMNFSATDYQRLFVDIFRNADTRKLILFGSGKYAAHFLAIYQHEYPVYRIVDNNPARQGQVLDGIQIDSPQMLERLTIGEYKILICVKNYFGIMEQLEGMGIREYSVYEPDGDYPRERKRPGRPEPAGAQTQTKKFHVGYVAGVFDLFHIGHLNMFKRAKEQCDYLIVGVVTDERTERIKGRRPIIPFEERVELVRSCRYVDEAVEIPTDYGNTRDAYRLYHFDCQFSGNDHIDDPHWIAEKKFLEENGAELVYFPYTEGTSSTKIRALIEKETGGA